MENITNIKLKKRLGRDELIELLSEKNINIDESLLKGVLGDALLNYYYLTYLPELVAAPTDELTRYYSRYYWLVTASEIYKKQFGRDNGLEQQVFKVLEQADFLNATVDWDIVEKIQHQAVDFISNQVA